MYVRINTWILPATCACSTKQTAYYIKYEPWTEPEPQNLFIKTFQKKKNNNPFYFQFIYHQSSVIVVHPQQKKYVYNCHSSSYSQVILVLLWKIQFYMYIFHIAYPYIHFIHRSLRFLILFFNKCFNVIFCQLSVCYVNIILHLFYAA